MSEIRWFNAYSGEIRQLTWPCTIQGLSRRRIFAPACPAATGGSKPMKPITTTALALIMAAAAAVPAAAQYGSRGASPDDHASAPQETQQTTTSAKQQPGIKPSNKALKAIIELQDAVNKNDVANIPAKAAAA